MSVIKCVGCNRDLTYLLVHTQICFDCFDEIPTHIPKEQHTQYLKQGKWKFRYLNDS